MFLGFFVKCSKQNCSVTVVKCVRFSEHPPLDVCHYVTHYMQRALKFRIQAVSKGEPKPRQLFLSYSTGKPLRRNTISKYILDILSLAGINTQTFKGHTMRGSLPSAMMKRGSSPGQIIAQGDWKHLGTFKRYYHRHSDSSIEGRLIKKVTKMSLFLPYASFCYYPQLTSTRDIPLYTRRKRQRTFLPYQVPT